MFAFKLVQNICQNNNNYKIRIVCLSTFGDAGKHSNFKVYLFLILGRNL